MNVSARYSGYEFVAELYDYVIPYRDRGDIEFYVEAAERSGGPVLELGCGTGRITIPTARAGIPITGLDSSRAMLVRFKDRLQEEDPAVLNRVRLVEGDMRSFNFDQRYALITMPFRSFQHLLTVQDQIACVLAARRHLEPEGRLILDVFNPSMEAMTRDNEGEEFGEEPAFKMSDGRRVVRTHRIVKRDFLAQIQDIELIYTITHPEGEKERLIHAFPMRYFFRYEIEHLLARCGLELERVLAEFAGAPYGSKYPGELICVARKA